MKLSIEYCSAWNYLPQASSLEAELKQNGTKGLFLGQFLPWDGYQNAVIAKQHGFIPYEKDVEGSIVNYENLDNVYMRIHDYFKFLKYGYDRVSDWASLAIRRKRMSRLKAIELSREYGGKYPSEYLGLPLKEVLNYIGMNEIEFKKICEKFTNKKIFKRSN